MVNDDSDGYSVDSYITSGFKDKNKYISSIELKLTTFNSKRR